jgi:hypothetical protein
MAARPTFDRTVWELRMERGPWKRAKLHRIALAIQAAGAADSADAAHAVIWDAVDALGGRPTVREALEHAGVDVSAVRMCLDAIDHQVEDELRAEEYAKLAEISSALPPAFYRAA